MLEPQSTVLFVLLIAIFGVLMWRTLAARRAAFRVLAACLAFVPAMVFGVLGGRRRPQVLAGRGGGRRPGRAQLRTIPARAAATAAGCAPDPHPGRPAHHDHVARADP